jgi:hypothetical protein
MYRLAQSLCVLLTTALRVSDRMSLWMTLVLWFLSFRVLATTNSWMHCDRENCENWRLDTLHSSLLCCNNYQKKLWRTSKLPALWSNSGWISSNSRLLMPLTHIHLPRSATAVSKHMGFSLLIRGVPRVRQWDMWDGIQYCNLMLCDLQIAIEDEAKQMGRLRMEIVAAKEIIRDWMCRGPSSVSKGYSNYLSYLSIY